MNKRHKKTWILVGLLLIIGASCVVLDRLGLLTRGPRFSHQVHVIDEDLSCTDCHATAQKADKAGMPKLAQCSLCHDAEKDAGKPPNELPAAFFTTDGAPLRLFTKVSDDVIFSHKLHSDEKVSCTECHGAIEKTNAVSVDKVWVSKEQCLSCHGEKDMGSSCKTCHTQIDENWKPGSHLPNWHRDHGMVARSDSPLSENQCSLCHQESTCRSCHQEEEPANHTNFFRIRGHGIEASVDRENCAVCHQQDTCIACHATASPQNHTGAWGGTLSQHCAGCHFPLQDEAQQCIVCHQGTPSHLLATPKPSDPQHSPAFNCRQCHIAGNIPPQPTLPHVDNGSDCNSCHN